MLDLSAEAIADVLVRDGMNPIVVTAGPEHTLREAARRMTARGVGATVVIGGERPAPCIITERDILQSNGSARASTPSASALISQQSSCMRAPIGRWSVPRQP
jgi:CBS domain-containing protein